MSAAPGDPTAGGGEPLQLDALGPKVPYRARNRLAVTDVTGAPTAELSLVPGVFVHRTLAALRRAAPLAPDERAAALARAADLFASGTVAGRSVAEYEHAVSRVGGVPVSVVRTATRAIGARLSVAHRSARQARPQGAAEDWRDPLTRAGRAVWTRRGETFAVNAAGNHPGTHSLWPEALALGYRVAVRPSRREPFTPHRLISALRTAGFAPDHVALLPTGHDRTDDLLNGTDLGMVYGGEDVVRRYRADPTVLTQGPGRSKVLLTADVDWRDHLDTIVESVAHHGGTGCVNATSVHIEGDPTPLCEALAERLGALPVLPPEDDKAVLPVQPVATARALAAHLTKRAAGTRPWLGADGVVAELGDGSAVLRPAVHQTDRADAPQLGAELPFPCVWVAPWTPEAGLAVLRHSLVLTVLTRQEELIDQLLDEPTISNVYVGDVPTYRIAPGLPHDGFLADFLMRAKTVIRS
ncbi:aldehyde dehydrogenase family protein [Streptomyces sp. ALI-76-A]|uniref:aldehyde dehydrogenase family protein n=1 Tax=Streptomyces sp. ALI-76-A TaxID=3025736 RepID=UPI00256EE5F4|nr:aldehyde dehydrogenase family protein [Streptomyces sp. ALI-76-A]MDL5206230.1 aldehyde dehydrogenase family protein [Streptomyces sp. ALI-76-A]